VPDQSSKNRTQKQTDEILNSFTKHFDLAFTAESKNRVKIIKQPFLKFTPHGLISEVVL